MAYPEAGPEDCQGLKTGVRDRMGFVLWTGVDKGSDWTPGNNLFLSVFVSLSLSVSVREYVSVCVPVSVCVCVSASGHRERKPEESPAE